MIPFEGFTRLDANFLYCPNQFLDVCVPNCSRSVVRLVAYFLDQTLGWVDQDGNPIAQHIAVSYRQLIASGISRGAVRAAIDEAMAAGFIRCVQEGRASITGQSAERGTYALRWDDRDDYQNSLENFQGFFAGAGYRTPVPNAFFRHVIPHEPLTVTKVVATVLRHTVGYQNQFGGRRSHAPLAYRFIQEFANMPDPKTLSQAISSAIASKYIVCVEEGRFHVDPTVRKPASYAVRWLGDQPSQDSGSKYPAGDRFKIPSGHAVQNTQPEQSRNPSETGTKKPAGDRFNNPSKERTLPKDTLKQQHDETAVAVMSKGFRLLRDAGFDEPTARRLTSVATEEQINQQIDWLPRRNPDHNRLGMLRRAIEESWSAPDRPQDIKTVLRERREKDEERALAEARENARLLAQKQLRVRHKSELQSLWDGLSADEQLQIEKQAYQNLPGEMLRHLFLTKDNHRLRACLAELNRQLNADEQSKSS